MRNSQFLEKGHNIHQQRYDKHYAKGEGELLINFFSTVVII